MKRFILLLLLLPLAGFCSGSTLSDSIWHRHKRNPFVGLSTHSGVVLPTNDFINNSDRKPTFGAGSLKFGYAATGSKWQDYAYGMPYAGVGLYFAQFFDEDALGKPFAL